MTYAGGKSIVLAILKRWGTTALDQKTVQPHAGGSNSAPLGSRLRERRQELALTLKEVADGAGLSVGFISQIERGITIPSLTSLINVCHVLKSEVGDFLTQPRGDMPVTRHDQRSVYALGSDAITYERLSASFPGNVLRSVIFHEPPGFRSEPMAHEGEEMFFILEGALTIEIDGERTILEAGDSVHFPSTRTHVTWNHTDLPTTVLHTCTMDVFGDGLPTGKAETSMAVRRSGKLRSAPKQLIIGKGKSK
ncbi:XRE family transcriptional regulator [Mesorhizobium sp. BAC0120]|uniref:helix-turn-helix domain-containing protein n=1 Tax=Mesorhizobium sp. BAC0120 TaxID=3090670 RepID=UPI00298CE661|nr:XRE family transcriptional regulator [Mesorhizobium sp. BAC0120]MDW6022600.1 XRE family transcriptional regulator [Mesorhizobium sp. BAC0120]